MDLIKKAPYGAFLLLQDFIKSILNHLVNDKLG